MKRVSIIAPFLSGNGGTETVLGTVMKMFSNDENLQFFLYVSGGVASDKWLNKYQLKENTYKINAKKNKVFKFLSLLSYLIKTNDEIVIAMTGRIVQVAYLIRKIFRKKYTIVSWIHFSLFDESNVRYKYLSLADQHLAIGNGIIKQLISLGIDSKRCHLVYNPVNLQNQDVKFNAESGKLIYIGRPELKGQKNLEDLINVVKLLSFNWTLDIFGTGPEEQMVKKYVAKQKLEDLITFHGWVNDPWKFVNDGTCLLLTSNYEGFPMVILESMTHGLPVVSANCPVGPEDIIKNGVNGYLYEMGDTIDAAKKVEMIYRSKEYLDAKEIQETVSRFDLNTFKNDFYDALNSF